MKFITFKTRENNVLAGYLTDNETKVVDMHDASDGVVPNNMRAFLEDSEKNLALVRSLDALDESKYAIEDVKLLAPLPNPNSFRDYVGFEMHMKNAKSKTNSPVPKEWYEFPFFYFSNHNTIKGPNEPIRYPNGCERLDYELELGCIIGKYGENIKAEDAEEYIFGFTVLNDWTARDTQLSEIRIGLGMSKGKDFATSIGPCIVTLDEFEPYREGDVFNLQMISKRNGEVLCDGNYNTVYYTFGQMIERASTNAAVHPGDLLGSGTVGFGTILETGPEKSGWLKQGDEIELYITGIGTLKNKIV